ncbi:microcystin-dependent protein [Filimonas zeae]|uniref:Microcystin dependent MdpB family protein n=1 Tax=Filimonas zeae TaxID=1737353 RepID=A0A917MX85_9BACT|nr:tail fiber protein [Filimonas zeae]MDR6340302.1 microcystin-dependent protein [Filimonas zeae]GGH72091.1 microcystin dependent MdpB family protein [Filimonas zeae]
MDGTVGEIRLFAAGFAPRSWAFCQGQLLPLNRYTALYAILGSNFGGNGTSTFGLPDFSGRTAIGVGQAPGLSPYVVGQQGGSVNVTILSGEMAAHNHSSPVSLSSPGSGTATLYGSNSGDSVTPGGNYIGTDGGLGLFTTDTSTPVAMATTSLDVTNVAASKLTSVTLAATGGTTPHNNMQPYLTLNYIICMTGNFPARN